MATTYTIATGNDNGSWDNAAAGFNFTQNGNPIDLGSRFGEQADWYRFQSVAINNGDTNFTAALVVQANATNSSTTINITISGNAADSATAPTGNADAKGKALTTATLVLNGFTSFVAGTDYSFDVTNIIKEIVARAGWVSGNNLQLFMKPQSGVTGLRQIKSFATSTSLCARLVITPTSTVNSNFLAFM